ncbi:MAG TPA: RIP metalloprotease RseP [Thermomicrobiales bacterium]
MPSSDFFNGLYIVPILAVLILVHEFGHFVSARMCGVKVEEFGIGIPPRLFGVMRKGVLWSINAIPFGGFVRVKGEDGKNMDPDSMNAKSPGQRAFFLAAGAGMNVILAVVLMILVIGVEGISHQSIYIQAVSGGSPAAKAGWQEGDRIVAVDGDKVETADEIRSATSGHAGEEITVTIERRGKTVDTQVVPREHPPEGEGRVGVSLLNRPVGNLTLLEVVPGSAAAAAGLQPGDRFVSINERPVTDDFVLATELDRFVGNTVPVVVERNGQQVDTTIAVPTKRANEDLTLTTGFKTLQLQATFEDVPALQVVPRGFQEAFNTTRQMIYGLKELFSSRQNLEQVAGPVGMGQLTSELVDDSALPVWVTLANIAIVLSLNLALLNLLPLPALDGGRLLFVVIEVLRGGRKIAPEKEGLVHFAGIVVLIGLMFVISFSDVRRIISGETFLP